MRPVPDTDPVAMGQLRDASLQETIDALAAPNPHGADMGLPDALCDDGGM